MPDVCGAVSADVQRLLRVQQEHPCMWRGNARDDDDGVERTLDVHDAIYGPGETNPQLSATDEARRGYQDPPYGWLQPDHSLPVRGLGDEARLLRMYNPASKQRNFTLTVRWRNVLLQIHADESSLLDQGRGRMPPVGDVEAGITGAAHDILSRLGAPPAPAAPLTGYAPGEVRQVRNVCDVAAATARRLAPGVTRHDVTLPGSALGSGCYWGENDGEQPSLTVDAEVITPSPATGEAATQIATTLFGQGKGEPFHASQVGDEAKIFDFDDFESGTSRNCTAFVRWRNLLVYVSYERWHHPSKEAMDRETIALAQAVLSDQG